MRRVAFTVAALCLAAGCGSYGGVVPAAEAPPVNGDPITTSAVVPAVPVSIAIPKLGVVDDVVPVKVQPNGAMTVPPVEKTGWWSDAVRPGESGVAVVLAHINFAKVPGAFARLSELRKGDEIRVTDANGVERKFVVTERRTFKKDAFTENHDLLFDNHNTEDLVAVTCGGTLVGHQYDSNVAVRATAVTT